MLLLFQTPIPDSDPTLTGLEGFLQLLERYGIMSIVVGLLIFFFWYQYKQNTKRDNDRYDALLKVVLELKENVPDPTDESIGKVAQLAMVIKGILKEAQSEFGCDWVHLWQLHNGIRVPGPNRIPLMFASLTYELVLDGADPVQVQFAQVPMSMIEEVVNILRNNKVYVQRSSTGTSNPITKVMAELGAQKEDFLQVLNSDGKLDCMLEMCWKVDREFSDEAHSSMLTYATRLSIALASYKDLPE